jgi:hypothetical protein
MSWGTIDGGPIGWGVYRGAEMSSIEEPVA